MRIPRPNPSSRLFVVVALIVTATWATLLFTDYDKSVGINILMTGVISGSVTLALKKDQPKEIE